MPDHEERPADNPTPEGADIDSRIDAVVAVVSQLAEKQVQTDAAVSKLAEQQARTDATVSQIAEQQARTDATVSQIAEQQARTDAAVSQLAEQQAQTNAAVSQLAEQQAQTNAAVSQLAEQQARTDAVVSQLAEQQARTEAATLERFTRIDRDLGYLKGAHAANVALRNASLIADDLSYEMIIQLPREELIGLSKIARDTGKPANDVRSFRDADLIMLVKDAKGYPAYIAVEASFTVNNRDIERAKRNADYLHEFTGLPATGVVAGVDIANGRFRNAEAVGVHCYQIPVKDLQAG